MNIPFDVRGRIIETERLLLRAFEESDLQDLYDYASVPGVGEGAGWSHHDSIESSKKVLQIFLEERSNFAVYHKADRKVIGSLGLHSSWTSRNDDYKYLKAKEMGFVLSKDYWGQGLAPEAAKAVIEYGFNTIGLEAFGICHFPENNQSRRVIEKCGFSYVLTSKYYSKALKKEFDDVRYILLRNPENKLREIQEASEKGEICNKILRLLPDWFGNEASIVDYTEKVQSMPFYAAFVHEKAAGFVALKAHGAHAAEVCVMGILQEFHRQGLGKMLINRCETYCRENAMEFLTVKTLDGSAEFKPYDSTRQFYLSQGFKPLEVFPLHWDADNPCLFMAKHIPIAAVPCC